MTNFKRRKLKNGLRVILVPQKESLTTTALVLVAAGSKYETKDINGLSHFLEHLCFKGTKTRPTAFAITSELDALGAEYNAFTGEEYTGYHAKADYRHTEKILDIVADMYVNPTIPEAEIKKEKGVIIEEINMYEDLPMRKVQEVMTELLYGDQPAGWPIAGRKEIIANMTREEIIDYRSKHYVADATIIVVSGRFDEKKVMGKIEKAFAGVPKTKKHSKLKTSDSQKSPGIKLQRKESDQTHLVLAVRTYDAYDDRRFALGVLSDILGGGMSSRLFQRIRDELGAAYYVRSTAEALTDHGYLAVSAGVDHKKLELVIRTIIEECRKIRDGKFTAEELARAKSHMAGGLTVGLETSDAFALYYGGQEVLDKKLMAPENLLKKIKSVTIADVKKVAKDIFRDEKLNLALIGPQEDGAPLLKLLKF